MREGREKQKTKRKRKKKCLRNDIFCIHSVFPAPQRHTFAIASDQTTKCGLGPLRLGLTPGKERTGVLKVCVRQRCRWTAEVWGTWSKKVQEVEETTHEAMDGREGWSLTQQELPISGFLQNLCTCFRTQSPQIDALFHPSLKTLVPSHSTGGMATVRKTAAGCSKASRIRASSGSSGRVSMATQAVSEKLPIWDPLQQTKVL